MKYVLSLVVTLFFVTGLEAISFGHDAQRKFEAGSSFSKGLDARTGQHGLEGYKNPKAMEEESVESDSEEEETEADVSEE